MNKIIYIALLAFLLTGFASCEKVNPLSEQGDLTGVVVPNAILSTIAATAVADTVTLSTTCWAVDDNIKEVKYAHEGFTSYTLSAKMIVTLGIGDDALDYKFLSTVSADSMFITETAIATFTDIDTCYQTVMNAYVVKHDFIIPNEYAIEKAEGNGVVTDMDSKYFLDIVTQFSKNFNKDVTKELFTIAEHDTTLFVFNKTTSETTGNDTIIYSGSLLDAGKDYVIANLTKDIVKTYLDKATKTEFAEVTILSTTTLTTDASSLVEKSFEILPAE